MYKKIGFGIARIASLALVIVMSQPVVAGIYNDDFLLGLDGWSSLSGGGTITTDKGAAVLAAGDGVSPYSAVLVQGDDGNFTFASPVMVPLNAQTFEFDLWQLLNAPDATEDGGSIFMDSLTLAIYDAVDSSRDLIFGGIYLTPAPKRQSFDISQLAGRNVAFSFELADENDGFNLSLALDNLKIEVPEGDLTVVFLFSLLWMSVVRRFFKAQ